jgi:triosephosphate isomerase
MTKRTLPLIVGNWKATPDTLANAKKIIKALDKKIANVKTKLPKTPYYIAVPDIFIPHLKEISLGYIGSENVGGVSIGQTTGVTIPLQLISGGADFTIIGHSEVRAKGETTDDIAHKVALSLQSKLVTILCIGETKRDREGKFLEGLEEEVRHCLALVSRNLFENLIIAYEPIWAIGANTPATAEECFEVVIALRRALSSLAGIDYAKKVHILYGGSVTTETASSFLETGGVDGLLIGRASQDANSFFEIIKECYKL